MNTNENFHNSVPAIISDKIESLADNAAENNLFLDGFMVDYLGTESTKNYLEFESYNGYISYNRGGIELSLIVDAGFGSGYTITKKQMAWRDKMQAQVMRDFKSDKGIDESVDIFDNEKVLNQFYDYETDYLNEVNLMMLQFRLAIDDDKNLITIDLSLCYGDEYFCSSSFELIGELKLNFLQFERLKFSTLERYFKRALKRA